jgi:DNA-binding response OmpR family regulator
MTDGGRGKQIGLSEENARLLGAITTVAKPFKLEEMLAVVNRELRG